MREIKLAAGWDLEPRPTNAVEDERVRTANRKRLTANCKRQTANPLTQSFDLLEHSFGDLANLARGQEREMEQLEQQ